MPNKIKRPCMQAGCSVLVVSGYCDIHKKQLPKRKNEVGKKHNYLKKGTMIGGFADMADLTICIDIGVDEDWLDHSNGHEILHFCEDFRPFRKAVNFCMRYMADESFEYGKEKWGAESDEQVLIEVTIETLLGKLKGETEEETSQYKRKFKKWRMQCHKCLRNYMIRIGRLRKDGILTSIEELNKMHGYND